jgi:hypothetical protein
VPEQSSNKLCSNNAELRLIIYYVCFLFDWLCKNIVAISDTFLIESLLIIMSQLLFINKYFQFFARSNLSATFQARVTIS